MQVKLIKVVPEIEVEVESVIEVTEDIGKSLISKGQAIEFTDKIEKQEQEEYINKKLGEIKMSDKVEVEVKGQENVQIEVKAPAIQKKSFGETIQMITKATTGQNITTAADGGYLTYTELWRDIVTAPIPTGKVWQDCTKIELGDRATAIKIPYLNNTGNSSTSAPRAYAVAEGDQKTVTKLAFGANTLTLFKQVMRVPLTWEIMEDVNILENYVKVQCRNKLGWMLDDLVFNGVAATNGYIGVLNAGANAFRAAATVAATMTYASLVNLIAGVLPEYRAGAKFYVSNAAWRSILQLNTLSSVSMPSNMLVSLDGNSILGYPVVVCEQLPALTTVGDIIFGNPSTYYVAYKGTPKELMDSSIRWDYNESELIFEFRSAGAPMVPKQTLVDATIAGGFAARS